MMLFSRVMEKFLKRYWAQMAPMKKLMTDRKLAIIALGADALRTRSQHKDTR